MANVSFLTPLFSGLSHTVGVIPLCCFTHTDSLTQMFPVSLSLILLSLSLFSLLSHPLFLEHLFLFLEVSNTGLLSLLLPLPRPV